jgi:endonuclease/exonuclease/phosphatase family metal-dependent hydrolase
MKNLTFLTLTIGIALAFSACSDIENNVPAATPASNMLKSTSAEFKVLTYNVAGLMEPFSSSNPSENTPIISGLINGYDIVQVQEDFNYHAALYDSGNNHPYRTSTSGIMGFGDGLNTLSYYPFTDFTREDWNDCNGTDCLTPKGFTWMKVRILEGAYIHLYNLHTNASTGEADLAARRSNITQLVNFAKKYSEGEAIIIMGDFNCRYTRSGDNIRLVSDELDCTDAWIKLIMGGVEPEKGANALVCAESDILTDYSCELVDKIFFRSNNFIKLTAEKFTYEDAKFRNSDGEMLSDHRPVMTRFKMELADNIRMSDQFGGPHGTPFTDVNQLPTNPAVSKIGIRAASRVDQVNISLSNGTTFTHGGTGGDASSINLASGEYITSVKMCSGQKDGHTRVFYIKFTTSNGRALAGGSTTNDMVTYTAPSGWQIVGFHGRSGDELDKCGVIYAPVN